MAEVRDDWASGTARALGFFAGTLWLAVKRGWGSLCILLAVHQAIAIAVRPTAPGESARMDSWLLVGPKWAAVIAGGFLFIGYAKVNYDRYRAMRAEVLALREALAGGDQGSR